MEPHRRQQFDALLHTAVERFVETAIQRCEGAGRALELLGADPDDERVRLAGFVDALFADFLLDGPGGACFVLEALPRRPWPDQVGLAAEGPAESVGQVLDRAARAAFTALLATKVTEALQQHMMFEPASVQP